MKPTLTIIGAGLGGSCLASQLFDSFEITFIELAARPPLLRDCIIDVGYQGHTYPLLESGLGGTTKAWHNALMEIHEETFLKHWPYPKEVLIPYYEAAYMMLAGVTRNKIKKHANLLKVKLEEMSIPPFLLAQNMFIPKKRINVWDHFRLSEKVRVIEGEAINFSLGGSDAIESVVVRLNSGEIIKVQSNYFVLAAGGIGSPLILEELKKTLINNKLANVGLNYQDHPMAFIGEVKLKAPLYKLWNWPIKEGGLNANLRIPLSFFHNGQNVSFQLRPAHHFRLSKPRLRIRSILNELRNFPLNYKNYIELFKNIDDLLEILSFKFGMHFPTQNYSVLMISEQSPSRKNSISRAEGNIIYRSWCIDNEFLLFANEAKRRFLEFISPCVHDFREYQNWKSEIFSSAHHSGMARISNDSVFGVCDSDNRVFGVQNLYICDASAIPNSGYVNTGLTIAALSLKLAKYLVNTFKESQKS